MTLTESLLWLPLTILGQTAKVVEVFLFVLIGWYDVYVYSPLQRCLSPVVATIPRSLTINGHPYDVFTANIVSWSRTLLVIPIAICLKYEYSVIAFLLVIAHDFLDHVDGLVAKQHKQMFGQIDDPLLGGFMDAFCDKIVNVLSLWSILMVTNFAPMTFQGTLLLVFSCVIIICYEFVIGVVRVQDYFRAFYQREYKIQTKSDNTGNTAAVMEGKLKEKLESMGIAFLCLAQSSGNITTSVSGIVGIVCLLLSVRLAHASLRHKLNARKNTKTMAEEPKSKVQSENKTRERNTSQSNDNDPTTNEKENRKCEEVRLDTLSPLKDKPSTVKYDRTASYEDTGSSALPYEDLLESDPHLKDVVHRLVRQHSVPSIGLDGRVQKVFSIGCFDLFHEGHRRLLHRLKAIGKQVIVGVHDSRSIFKLKKRVPIDSTERRMFNVKQIADVVYCIAGTDPTPFLSCIVDTNDGCSCVYVRGDDMQAFPAREFCEKLMPVTFLPYSSGVSSTKLRKLQHDSSKFGPHVKSDHDDILY
ncbi:uncharacterized protein LOC110454742 [Mizuhopecten yessoensis]|uniref:uncharacterized protein LOC110454742 n=1 Tax=Mizuhopecten yessoensis TaxID=6573 RepID=UPI000B45B330|nr:uncharacterized protein LOC110454742 [Mizuhopecten yessoensis]